MSANQVIIRKVAEDIFEGRNVDIDGYMQDPEYYNDRKPDFTATTLEGAIQQYRRFREVLANKGMSVEYGLDFEGI